MQLALFRKRARAGLASFVQDRFLPLKAGNAPATLNTYRATLRHWTHLMGDPPLTAIDLDAIVQFRNRLRAGRTDAPGRGPNGYRPRPHAVATVNQALRNLRTMLRAAAKTGLIDRAPPIDCDVFLPEHKRRPRAIAPETLERIYRATAFAWYPRLGNTRASDWWQTLILGAVTTGFRLGALLALQWDWINRQELTIRLPAEWDKAGEDRQKPLHSTFLALAVKLRRANAGEIFPWPHSRRQFTREWHAIQRAAGLPKREHVHFHALKKTCLTWFAQVAPLGVTQYMGDHATSQTTLRYYVEPVGTREAVDRLPLPQFLRAPPTPPESAPASIRLQTG